MLSDAGSSQLDFSSLWLPDEPSLSFEDQTRIWLRIKNDSQVPIDDEEGEDDSKLSFCTSFLVRVVFYTCKCPPSPDRDDYTKRTNG